MKIGQKVVCVDDSPGWLDGCKELKKDKVYTITHLIPKINNIMVNGASGGWNAKRFRPLDYDFVEEVLSAIQELEVVGNIHEQDKQRIKDERSNRKNQRGIC